MSDNKKFWILQYNNYYNRQIKRETSNAGYLEHYVYLQTANFTDYNDGINASILVGGPNQYEGNGDYVVVLDENNAIESRWFIVENTKTRGGQWNVLLRRDVIADFYDEVINAPCYIEKATPTNYYDPAIFNKESINFNQIKQWEQKLWDHTKVPWLVGYCAKGEHYEANLPQDYDLPHTVVATYNDIPNLGESGAYLPEVDFRIAIQKPEGIGMVVRYLDFSVDTTGSVSFIGSQTGDWHIGVSYTWKTNDLDNAEAVLRERLANITLDYNQLRIILDGITEVKRNEILDENNRIYKTQDTQKFYKVSVSTETFSYYGIQQTSKATFDGIPQGSGIAEVMRPIMIDAGCNQQYGDGLYDSLQTGYLVKHIYNVITTNATIPQASVSFDKLETSANGAPYAIFCMPYGSIQYGDYSQDEEVVFNNKDLCFNIMTELINRYGGENATLFDAQILPYCPIAAIENNMKQGFLRVEELNDVSMYTAIRNEEDGLLGYLFHVPFSTVKYKLPYFIYVNPKDLKMSNECDVYRLVSPNWNGQFEFSAAKNYGVENINVDIELKPYNPYIHVAPEFKGLYGSRDNDAIGLICGGDFSMTQTSNAFATYARQNKNFQEIFDRQIQNMEVQQNAARTAEAWQIGTGTITGAASGATAGGVIGSTFGPYGTAIGAAAGGVVGGVSSLAGGLIDRDINEKLRTEALDYTKDLYNMNLQNIKALPDSLTKVSTFNPNNEMYVFLEKYSCTPEEKEALQNKLKYNGYTIGRISTIAKFQHNEPTYIKGKIIRLENLGEDAHMANVIAEEINKGVFI